MTNLGTIYLTPHFSLNEMCDSLKAERLNLSNIPEWDVLVNLNRLCIRLEQIRFRLRLPIIVNSGYRSPKLNDAVGGVHNSYHIFGRAADIRCSDMDALRHELKLFEWEEFIDYGNFIHIAL